MSPQKLPPGASGDKALPTALERLEALRIYKGAPAQFWTEFLQIALSLTSGTDAVLLTRSRAPEESGLWRESFCWPPGSPLFPNLKAERGDLERLGLLAEGDGSGTLSARGLVAARLATGETNRSAIVVVQFEAGVSLELHHNNGRAVRLSRGESRRHQSASGQRA
ncbi:MAG: hypothetical protein EOP84_33685, partial [Verrucomicrobiaceae bacterium]